jgi:hypothetical protein
MATFNQEITPETPIFFLHLPKTAGTTLNTILETYFHQKEIFPYYFTRDLPSLSPEELKKYKYFRGHLHYDVITRLLPRKPVTLTMLRQPVELFISFFAHLQRFSEADLVQWAPRLAAPIRNITLTDFVNEAHLYHISQNSQSYFIVPRFDFSTIEELKALLTNMRQQPWPVEADDIKYGQSLLSEFAFVGLSERFQESLFLLAYTFGWRPITEYQTLNIGSNKPEQAQISPDILDQIRQINAADQALYDYGQTLFEIRYTEMTQNLLEKYGASAHARLTLPLPLAVMRDLLEKHYEVRFQQSHRPVSALSFTFDQPISGAAHWQRLEDIPGHGLCRWTGPGIQSSLDFALSSDNDLMIRFRILMGITPEVLNSLRLRVNGEPIPLRKTRDETGAFVFEGRIFRAILAKGKGPMRLLFEVAHTVAPSAIDPDNQDSRQLGVLFNRIEITPATPLDFIPITDFDNNNEDLQTGYEQKLASVKAIHQTRDE